MILIPAIDLKDGKIVRLFKGSYDKITNYEMDPVNAAQHWENMGAQWLHVVDLDGTKTGEIKNFQYVADIVKSVKIPIEMGGGIRNENDIERLLDAGVERVIVGTKVMEDKKFLETILKKWGTKIAFSLDSRKAKISPGNSPSIPVNPDLSGTSLDLPWITLSVGTHGWTTYTSQIHIKDKDSGFLKELKDWGLSCLIFTDITKDGTLKGPNLILIERILKATDIPLIIAGGISSIEDIRKLITLGKQYPHLYGAITGKAIYEGTLDFKEAVKLCSPNA